MLVVAAGMVVLAFYPSDGKATLLLPVAPGSSARLAALAVGQGASILGRGPTQGSLVVLGAPGFAAAMLARGVLAIRAGDTGCQVPA